MKTKRPRKRKRTPWKVWSKSIENRKQLYRRFVALMADPKA